MDILLVLASSQSDVSTTELAKLLKLSMSTTSRLLTALEAYEFVSQDAQSQRVRLGPRCYQLGQVFLSQVEVAGVAEPFMRQLTRETELPTHLGVLNDYRLLRVKHVEPDGYVFRLSFAERNTAVGELYCEAIGKVVLAFQPEDVIRQIIETISFRRYTSKTITSAKQFLVELDRVRQQGYAVDDCERTDGVRCVAVPIWNHHDNIAAGISVSGSDRQVPKRRVEELVKRMQQIADHISRRLGSTITSIPGEQTSYS